MIARMRRLMRGRPLAGKRKKFNNESCRYNGRTYDSRLEARHAALLDAMRSARPASRRVIDVCPQKRVQLYCNGRHICDHVIDFLVAYADGHQEFHEVKGFPTNEWRIKRELYLAQGLSIPYIVIRPGGVWETAK